VKLRKVFFACMLEVAQRYNTEQQFSSVLQTEDLLYKMKQKLQ